MTRGLQHIVMILSVMFIGSCGSSQHGDVDDRHADENHKHAENEIMLKPEQAEALGVKTIRLAPIPCYESVTLAARLLPASQSKGTVTSPVSGIVTLSGAAQQGNRVAKGTTIATISGGKMSGGDIVEANAIALKSANSEYERVKALFDAGLATRQELNAAETALQLARNASSAGTSARSAVAPISGIITSVQVSNGQFVETGEVIADMSTLSELYARADVPVRYASHLTGAIKARLFPDGNEPVEARLKSVDTAGGDMPGYVPAYFAVDNTEGLYPGGYVEAVVAFGKGVDALCVPRTALFERLGNKFVYVKIDDDCYVRRQVKVGAFDGESYEITDGLSEGDEVVTVGASFIRMAEASNVVPEGHSHHH